MTQRRGYERFQGRAEEFASASAAWWPEAVTAPEGAPNVIVMLIDDLGFSDLGPFGSEIPTPNIDALAGDGWVFTNYRTAPMCSPARAALLTGINPHRAGFGFVAHVDPGYPGHTCALPDDAPTLAESLRAGGYATFMVGKWHLTPEAKLHDGAEKSTWPLQRGFDRYFGCMDAFTSVHHPHRLTRDNSVIDIAEFPDGYFLTDELVSESVRMIDELRVNDPAKPFFLYFAHTAVHGPIQAKEDDIARHAGRYEAGWNALRAERFARQRELGVIPADAALPDEALDAAYPVPQWADLPLEERRLYARHMEVYAAAVEEIDRSVGALVAHLEAIGERENTLIVIASDNGGTAEGGPSGTRSYFAQFATNLPLPEGWVKDVPREVELIGGPQTFTQYPTGWARVSNTPFRSFKSSMYEGGVHAPLVVSWPGSDLTGRGLRDQFVFVSDLAPTILELTGVAPLAVRAGKPAVDMDGQSAVGVLRGEKGSGRAAQYFECVGRRGMIDGDWKAVSQTLPAASAGGAGGEWELYHLGSDPTEIVDVAASEPDRVAALAERWRAEGWRNAVFPLFDDGSFMASRPETEAPLSEPVVIPAFRAPLERFRSAKLTVLRSFTIEIDVETTAASVGVLVAHGDQGGGYVLVIIDGALQLSYNAYGAMHRQSSIPLAAGAHRVVVYVSEGEQLTWSFQVDVDGAPVMTMGPVPMLLGMAPFTGISVGYDYGGPVDWQLYEKHRSFRLREATLQRVRYVPGPRSAHDRTVLHAVGQAVLSVAD